MRWEIILSLLEYEYKGVLGIVSYHILDAFLDCKIHGASMGPTWVLSAPYGPHVGPMNLAIRVGISCSPFR